MTRRLLGPIGGPIVFFLVAALVFAGLGWVTYSAIHVEQAQREAAARADLGNRLRVALWQLDGRMLPALGIEDSRPYYHYAPPDPAATPLFVANLPEWMKLHFQLDSVKGWTSPLVLDPATAELVRAAWADVAPRNMSPERSHVLDELKARFPARVTHDLFAATDRSIPDDSLSLAAPLVAGDVQTVDPIPNPPRLQPDNSPAKPAPQLPDSTANGVPGGPDLDTNLSNSVRVLGLELCLPYDKPNGMSQTQQAQFDSPYARNQALTPGQQNANGPRAFSQAPGGNARGGRLAQKDVPENEKKVADWLSRAGLVDRAIRDAKNAAEYQMPRGQLGNSYQNYLPSIDQRYTTNSTNKVAENKVDGRPTSAATQPGSGTASGNLVSGFSSAPTTRPSPIPPGLPPSAPAGLPALPHDDKLKDAKGPAGKSGDRNKKALDGLTAAKDTYDPFAAPQREALDKSEARDQALFAYRLSSWFARPDQAQLRGMFEDTARRRQAALTHSPLSEQKSAAQTTSLRSATVTPGVERPETTAVPAPTAPQPLAIHLGSMRPQWITAPDGSNMLVLVRAANVDGKVVYQGVVVDWPKLEEELRSVVTEQFPAARLLPVKDTSPVYPDRAMTALPVQLDPGPEPELAPAGWTTLRLGLVLAWLAAIIAFAAIGFAGWSLIDLAERRIRFVSAVTHELRTPLTSLRLYLDLLVSGMVQNEQKRQEYLGTLAVESDRLHRLIDNVLDFARLEKRKKNGDIRPANVNDLLDQLRLTWTDRVAHDGKELIILSSLALDRAVSTDAAMIQQIVGNLIDNARKYTRDAADQRIWLRARPGIGEGVILEVEDRGTGVPAGERRSIFKPFRRGEQADSRAGGAGLGLALAKSWADVLGASLCYHPAEGGTGACFRLELPGK